MTDLDTIIVRTQKQLDDAPKMYSGYPTTIKILPSEVITVRKNYDDTKFIVCGLDKAVVVVRNDVSIEVCGRATVKACDNSQVIARDQAKVIAYDNAQVTAFDRAEITVTLFNFATARVKLHDRARIIIK